ncbi:uncharacterized protein LOC129793968 [Lutzomyia longipalpis]|uniref:uncharacterized protein LOC129793968 n=1 Tax=Lutzomyia longipalpis TaxID=7200 RepID=UPI002483F34D|nr:uncharacterized protein LOC129793968 [Lutzomyia longipalpis]
MKVLICLSVFVAATVALHLPFNPLAKLDSDDASFPRPEPPQVRPPHMPEMSPELREFLKDVRDFMRLLPRRELRQLVRDAFKNDKEFRKTIKYMRSPQFHVAMKEIGDLPEVQELFSHFVEQHIEGQDLTMRALTAFESEIEILPLPEPVESQTTGGLCGLIDRVMAILPHEELRALHLEKVANGGVFAKFVGIVTSDAFLQRVEAVLQSERFIELTDALRERGVCLDKMGKLQMSILGFH